MMKIIGIVLIALSIVALGYLYYINLQYRQKELVFFTKLISEYQTRLKWYQDSLAEVIREFKYDDFTEYISEVNNHLSECNYLDSFAKNNENYNKFHLSIDDKKVIENFLKYTGKFGLDSEIELCNKTLKELETLKTEAETKFKNRGPFYIKLSVTIGLLIIILLF